MKTSDAWEALALRSARCLTANDTVKGASLVADAETTLPGTTAALAFTSVTPVGMDAPSVSSIVNPSASWQEVDDLVNTQALVELDLIAEATGPQLYVVVGSYRELANAEKHSAREDGANITPVIVNNQQHFRVLLGPFGDSISTLARSDPGLKSTGGWPVWLCTTTLRAPPCVTQVALAP